MRGTSTDSSSLGVEVAKFTTPEAREEFTRLLGKPIAKERGFLPSPGDGELVQIIQNRGGSRFVRRRGRCR